MTLGCRICGGPKPPGRGRKLCTPCFDATYNEKFSLKTHTGRKARPRVNPCNRCGGPKVAEGEYAKSGQKFCAACKEITTAEYIERRRVAMTERRRKQRGSVHRRASPGKAKARVKTPKLNLRVERTPRKVNVKVEVRQAPAPVRSAWRSAHNNSQIKRLYPTMAKLNQAYNDGKLRGYEDAARRLP